MSAFRIILGVSLLTASAVTFVLALVMAYQNRNEFDSDMDRAVGFLTMGSMLFLTLGTISIGGAA